MGEAARHGGDDEADLFRAAVADAAPLSDRERRRPPAPERGRRSRDPAPGAGSLPFSLEPDGSAGRAHGVNRRTLSRLAAGKHPVEATLDLHRLTLAAAQERVARFLAEARSAHPTPRRCVLIITGKADRSPSPDRLRDHVPTWLAGPLSAGVLAFSRARPEHGGAGALYVLLRAPGGSPLGPDSKPR